MKNFNQNKPILSQNYFNLILNQKIFFESRKVLIKKIIDNPNRFIGLLRPTKPKGKILQNLLQSHEIKFGDALEEILKQYIANLYENSKPLKKNYNYTNLNNKIETINLDQLFLLDDKTILFIEQKVRDDHDSTKKRGQIDNFEKKLNTIQKEYTNKNIIGIFYFVDDRLKKNKKFYVEEINQIKKDYKLNNLFILYGKELFDELAKLYNPLPNINIAWIEINNRLTNWKLNIPELPEINFDIDHATSFQEIKELELKDFRTLFKDSNKDLRKTIFPIIFPEKKVLNLLKDYFNEQKNNNSIYNTFINKINEDILSY